MDSGQLNDNWNAICNQVKSYPGVDAPQVNALFSRLQLQAMSEGFIMLTADNDFIKSWIERHYRDQIAQALLDLYHVPFTVVIEVDPTAGTAVTVASPSPSPAPASGAGAFPVGAATPSTGSPFAEVPESAAFEGHTNAKAPAADGAPFAQGGDTAEPVTRRVPSLTDAPYVQHTQDARAFASFPTQTETPRTGFDGYDPNGLGYPSNSSAEFGGAPGSSIAADWGKQSPEPSSFASTPWNDEMTQPHDYRAAETYTGSGAGSMQAKEEKHPVEMPSVQPAPAEREVARDDANGSGGNDVDRTASTLTFENFVIGDSNRMAYSMAVNVAEMPGKTPLNPLFIYGKSGLGKTHLMRAIQNYICETQPHLRTVYVDSAELLSDYMEASAAHDKEKSSYKNFKTHYEEADVLLIDDIQYLQGKKQTLDIVFQIFNKLTSQGKQIVLSADRAPKNIDIDERYHSRFNQGGTIDIQPPEVETKLGIVKSFINEYCSNEGLDRFYVPEDIQMYIAENSSSNIRELKSAVTKVIYQMTFFGKPDITVADVRVLLENHFSGGNSRNLTVEDIQKEVENFFKVRHSDLVGPKRARNIVYPRQIAIYLCRQLLDLPFNDIGKKFNRDHSTAMHSVATVEEMMRTSREVQEEIETLKQIIREL